MATDVRTRRLIALNAFLLAGLALVTVAGHVSAQPRNGTPLTGVAARSRGDYAVVPGRTQAGNADAVYVLDATNQEILALSWDRNKDRFSIIGYRSLANDARVQQQTR
ncbi:MAG TPA: hypothetical protein PK308_04000 [Phycisphaerales bacterium]|jgi:hypothetical protein|nr:hypothetical protein [Phycisphaerales bacterium]